MKYKLNENATKAYKVSAWNWNCSLEETYVITLATQETLLQRIKLSL